MQERQKVRISSKYWLEMVKERGGHFMIAMRTNIAG